MVSDFTAHGRRDIADRDPSDGSYEEAEKRGSVHGDLSSKRLSCCSTACPDRHLQLKLPVAR